MIKAKQKLLKTFSIDYTSETDDVRYQGVFTTKKLSVADSAALGVRKAQLNGGMHFNPEKPGYGVEESTDDFNAMLAHLQIALTQTPKWWNLNEIADINLVTEVYKEVASFESSFHSRRRNNGDTSGLVATIETNSHSDVQDTNPQRESREVVGEKISAALEP